MKIRLADGTTRTYIGDIPILINPSGYALFPNEESQYKFLNKYFFPTKGWVPDFQYELVPKSKEDRVDYFVNLDQPILIEVKNWFVRVKDVLQIVRYIIHATERYQHFKFLLICGGIETHRRKILEKLGVEILLTSQLIGETKA